MSFPWMMPQWEDVTARMTSMALSPTGKRAVVEARGEIFTIPAEKGDVRNLTESSGSAERQPAWSPDGKWIVFLSYSQDVAPTDHPYYQQVYLRLMPAAGGKIEVAAKLFGGQGTINVPSWSPDSKQVAFVSYELLRP